MKLSQIALKNVKRNFSFYSLYLFSVSFVLTIFFCFSSFSMNKVIMESISSDGRVETMCRVVALFIMIFVLFYMSFSNRFFLLRRMKELGIYALLGYRKSAMLVILTFENIIICISGLVVGILMGGLLHQGLTAGIVNFLGLSIDGNNIGLINLKAVFYNMVFVLAVLLLLTLSNAKLLWKSTLLDLVRLEKKSEEPIRVHLLSTVIGVFLLISGYALALDIARGKDSLWHTVGFSPIALLTLFHVVIGTSLFIYSFLPYACQKIKQKRCMLFHENTIVVVPKFMHRIRSNAKSLILLILLSAGTLTVLGATVLSVWYPLEALERIVPSAIEYRVMDEKQINASLDALNKEVGNGKYLSYETTILKVTAISDQLPWEYNLSADKGRLPGFECISQSNYYSLMMQQTKVVPFAPLSANECILIKYRPDATKSDIGAAYTLTVGNDRVDTVTVKDTSLRNPIGFGNSVGTLVITDEVYQKLLAKEPESFRVVSINGEGMRSNKMAYQCLKKVMPDNMYLVSAWYRQNELVRENSSTLLLVCFTTVIFLVATGSVLYFQNISSVTYDKPDYKIMGYMGYNNNTIKRVLRRQIQIYFFIPYIMGLLHSIFALICYKIALMDDLLGKSSAVTVPILFSIFVFSIIYLSYYQITKRSCYKIALSQVAAAGMKKVL